MFTKAWKGLRKAVTEFWNKFQVLEEVGIAQRVKRVCGTSVGAIIASLVAVAFTSEDLKEFMETDLRKVLVGKIRSHLDYISVVCYKKEWRIHVIARKTFLIKDFFSKCDRIRVTFTEEILNGKIDFLCSVYFHNPIVFGLLCPNSSTYSLQSLRNLA